MLRRREDGLPLVRAIDEVLAGTAAATPSVFAAITDRHPELTAQRLRKPVLVDFSHALEDECLAHGEAPLFLGAFQTEQNYQPSQLRWTRIAERAAATIVVGGYPELVEHRDVNAPVLVTLDHRAELRREWVVVVESPQFSGVLAAREVPTPPATADRDRLFDATWSVDPSTTRFAARIVAGVAAAAGSVTGERLVTELEGPPLSCRDTADVATRLLRRVLAYTDGRR